MKFLIENWLALVSLVSSPIGVAIGWVLGGRAAKAQELKKGNVEIEITEVDYAAKVRELYDNLNAKLAQENESLKSDKEAIIAEFKEEKEYFRTQVDELRKQSGEMQIQFNSMQLAYAKEVEQSQNWEKLHRELTDKYNVLAKDHEQLKGLYAKLKDDFDKHKKSAK
jgi:DNA repair exonuclease SbcCD ATPase subunit